MVTEKQFIEMADELRAQGFNFVFVLEKDDKVYSQSSIKWGSKLKDLEKEAFRVSRAGRYHFPGQVEIK